MFKLELKRAFNNKRYIFSIIIVIIIVLLHFFTRTYQYINIDLSKNVEYPLSSYQCYLGGDPLSMYASLFYIIVPLLVTLPHGGSDCFDIHQGYIYNVISRESKSKYYVSKYFATLISGGTIAIIPLILSFFITCAYVPCLPPEIGVCRDAITDHSFLSTLYYTYPLIYTMIYFLINFIFIGLISTLGLFISLFTNKILIAHIGPLIIYLALYSITNTINSPKNTWNPAFILQPSQFYPTSWYVFVVEILIMVLCGLYYIIYSTKKERIV